MLLADARSQVITSLQTVYIADPNIPSEVDAKKQATAFPPNFIHSLDATHMMLTALECRANNLTFASVHDSYWTHASTIDHMSIIIRDTFIALHGSNILERLYEEVRDTLRLRPRLIDVQFKARYAGHVVPVVAASPSQTKQNSASSEFVVLSNREMASLPGEEHDVLVKPKKASAAAEEEENESEPEGEEPVAGEQEEESNREMSRSERLKASRGMTTAQLRKSKMVDLWELVPPVPKKGDFDVKRIKESLYFFS